MQNCNKCGAELGEHESDLCSNCASSDDRAKNAADVLEDEGVTSEDNAVADDNDNLSGIAPADGDDGTSDDEPMEDDDSPHDESAGDGDTPSDEQADDADISGKSALIALTKKEKQKRLFITLAAGVVIVGLIVALIFVIARPGGNDDASNFPETAVNGTPAPDGGEAIEPDREMVCPDEILARLINYDGDDFTSFFTEMMFEYSEDPGMFTSPGGYLFMEGIMVEEFYNAAAALEIGEISGLVETVHGFHIIYRIPIDPDAAITGTQNSLRMVYALNALHETIDEWIDNLEPEFTEEYYELDIVELFGFSQDADLAEAPTDGESGRSISDIDFDEIFATFEPDTPMINVGAHSVTWEELFSTIFMSLASLYENFGYVPDISEPLGDDMQPLYEAILEVSINEMENRLALKHNAAMLNIGLSEEDYQFIDDFMAQMKEQQGGEDEFIALLWDVLGIKNLDLYRQIQATHILPYVIFQELYGEEGELFPDDEIFRIAEEDGLIMAKHILIRHETIIPGGT